MKLPKYVKLASKKHRTLTYQRRLPKDVAALTGQQNYSRPLGLKPPPECSESELAAAVERETETFNAKLKQIRNSDPDAFTDREIDRLAADILRKEGLRAGQFAGPYHREEEELGITDFVQSVTGAESDEELSQSGDGPTTEQLVRQKAYRALLDANSAPKVLLLSQLLDQYLKEHPKEGKALADTTRSWNAALSFIGDRFAAPEALSWIHDGLDNWVAERVEEVSPATVQRGLNDVLPVLKWAARKHRIDSWHIVPPQLPNHQAKSKRPFTQEEQRKLVALCREKNDGKAAVMLMMLQGGMMPSEIARLDIDATYESLAALNPHVLIGYESAKTKTQSRKRIVPVVVEVGLIQEHLVAGIQWAASVVDGSASAAINKRLRAAGFSQTSHSFRHTLSQNIKASHVAPLHGAMIAGWKADTGIPEHMMHYGAEGVSEYLAPLTETSKAIHHHLLREHDADGTVVQMREHRHSHLLTN